MQPFSFRAWASYQRLLRRLDHASVQINPFLAIIAIGLAILNAVCLIALIDIGNLSIRRPAGVSAGPVAAAPAVPGQ
jgi:hypothetical protein